MLNLYADGGVIKINPSPFGGTFAWCLVENERIIRHDSGVVEPLDIGLPAISNNLTELLAVLMALTANPDFTGTLWTDSLVTLNRITTGKAFKNIPNSMRLKALEIRRDRKWQAHLLKGHPSKSELARGMSKNGYSVSKFNVWCDKKCGELATNFLKG